MRLESQPVAPVETRRSNHHPRRSSLVNRDGWQAEAEVIVISSIIIMGGRRVCVIKPKPMSPFMADHMDGRGGHFCTAVSHSSFSELYLPLSIGLPSPTVRPLSCLFSSRSITSEC
ncbi:unnamed protein product [Arctogadus glacialis]